MVNVTAHALYGRATPMRPKRHACNRRGGL